MINFLMCVLSAALLNVFSLDGSWEYKSSVEDSWHLGKVPGCVHLDLMSDSLIPDPYYGNNEKLVQWVGEKDWTYRRTFTIGEEVLKGNHQTLVLEGVDTYAKVFLNGKCIQVCDNMFRTWRIDVKDLLRFALSLYLVMIFISIYPLLLNSRLAPIMTKVTFGLVRMPEKPVTIMAGIGAQGL